ncbi:MAG: hypothetical protein UE819_06975 [Ruminococcus sp.]|nr:hypothetical protein [Ruminococcus sp.]
MNPESFSSLPEGQWLLQQVQTAFPNCPAEEQPDGVAILCTIRQTIGHPPLFRECILFFQQHPQHPWERWMLPFLCMNVSVLGSCGSRFIRLGLHGIHKILLEKLEKLLKKENASCIFL